MAARITKKKMPETMYRASRCCRLLGNPTAYLIIRLLGEKRKTPSELAKDLGISMVAVSTTLRHLRNVDFVRYETKGNKKEYWLKDKKMLDVLDSLEKWVDTMREKKE